MDSRLTSTGINFRILPRDLSPHVWLRVGADILSVNLAFVAALACRFIWAVVAENVAPHALLHDYLIAFATSAWFLTLVSLFTFYLCGFYTHGRAYQGRYKALIVSQAVTVVYLVFTTASFLVGNRFHVPRSTIVVAYLITLVLLLSTRLWASLWKTVIKSEHQLLANAPEHRKIESILVIGGDGYIGSALLPKLLARGYRVRVLSLLLYGTEPILEVLKHPRLEIVQADFRQIDKVVQAMRDIDAVVHLGAIVGDPACALDESLTVDVNLMATRMIAEVAKGHGVNRFIFASTCSVYGAADEILDERSSLKPVSLYARTKVACERVLLSLKDESFAPVCLRFGTIFGLSGRTRFDLVVNLLTAKALVDGEMEVHGGNQWRPFLHVDDAALSVLKVLEAPLESVRHEVFNVGSDGENHTLASVAETIRSVVPTVSVSDVGSTGDPRNYRVSFAKIRDRLGFEATWTLEQGVRQVTDAIKSGKVVDYRESKYSNVKWLSEEGKPLLLGPENGWAAKLLEESSQFSDAVAEAVSTGEVDAIEEVESTEPQERTERTPSARRRSRESIHVAS